MHTITPARVREVLRHYILGTYLFTDDTSALDDDASFQETRYIDSMGMMQLIQFIEEQFGIKVEDSDLVPENLDSVNRLVRLIVDKRGVGDVEPANTLVDLLQQAAAAHPGNDALVTRDARVTYEALWSGVTRAARALIGLGVTPGDRVALLAEHTPETVAAYYAILAAGGVVVPLDGHARPRELTARIAHTGARLVVADARSRWSAAVSSSLGAATHTISASELLATDEEGSPPPPLPRLRADDLAALMFTSGTTAEPKAVMLTHANFVSNVSAVVEYLGLTPADRVLWVLPIFYAYGASVLQTHLSAGATVLIGDMVFAQRTVAWMAEERVTGFSGVPWMFSTLLDRTSFAADWERLSLRYLTQAGARMAPADLARVQAAFPDVALFVMYGQTEATSRLSYLPPSELKTRPESVGHPLPNVRIEIRRHDGSVAELHESGEVVVQGPNVMSGYWNASEATAAVISIDEHGRWLHTGDAGHLDADGYLYLEGRLTDIIKAWGHRVSPAEVEEVALLMPGVAEAAAVGVPDGLIGEAIHLYVVREPGCTLTDVEILAHCQLHLSFYKLPRRVIFAGALPRTANGKTQRHLLADLAEAAS